MIDTMSNQAGEERMTGVAQQRAEDLRYRGHVARLYLTPRQAAVLDGQGQTARAVWNLLHEWYTWAGPGGIAKRPSIAEIDLQLREARANADSRTAIAYAGIASCGSVNPFAPKPVGRYCGRRIGVMSLYTNGRWSKPCDRRSVYASP